MQVKSKIRNLAFSFLLSISVPGAILAAVADDEEVRYYDVEIVIFKNIKAPRGSEFVLPVSSPLIDEDILDLSSPLSIEAAREKSFEIITGDELRLIEPVKRIIDSPRYSLLLHTAWRQPGLDKDQSLPVWIKGGRIFGADYTSIDDFTALVEGSNSDTGQQSTDATESLPTIPGSAPQSQTGLYELEGKITIVLSRYLHTYADLVLRKPRLSIDSEIDISNEFQIVDADLPDTRILNNHPLKEHRRMRSNKLHYLDNPEFSMLILITRYEAPENGEETDILSIDDSSDGNLTTDPQKQD